MFARHWNKVRKCYVYFCHFDKIAITAADPFVGKWEEIYAKVDPILCPNCDTKMRYFATSTGYMTAKCPKKNCMAKVETTSPDREVGEVVLLDKDGEPIEVPNVDRPIATPEQLGPTQ